MSEVRMTKYFQNWLKIEFARLLGSGDLPKTTYFAWLKQLRELKQLPEYYARYQASRRPQTPTEPNANRATHLGTCQCCLRVQMLPNGILAKHGYQVAFRGQGGFFSGVCRGSGDSPFELSCEAMKRFVAEASLEAGRLQLAIEQVEQNAILFPTQGWYEERFAVGGKFYWRWVYIQYHDHVIGNTGKRYAWETSSNLATAQAARGNGKYIAKLQAEQKQLRDFINDRLEKIANWTWTIKPLIERTENH